MANPIYACLFTVQSTKFLILVTRHTLTSSYNITSPQGPRVHLPVTYFLFRDITFHLVLALSASLRPKYGTPHLFTYANPKHTHRSDVILRRTTLFQPISPLAAPVMRPDSLPRLWRYINLLLTYLLTYLRFFICFFAKKSTCEFFKK